MLSNVEASTRAYQLFKEHTIERTTNETLYFSDFQICENPDGSYVRLLFSPVNYVVCVHYLNLVEPYNDKKLMGYLQEYTNAFVDPVSSEKNGFVREELKEDLPVHINSVFLRRNRKQVESYSKGQQYNIVSNEQTFKVSYLLPNIQFSCQSLKRKYEPNKTDVFIRSRKREVNYSSHNYQEREGEEDETYVELEKVLKLRLLLESKRQKLSE